MIKEEKPDSLRSWAICFAACVINTMLSGISRTTSLYYVALIDTYGVSRLQANLPFTMRNVVRNLTGPLVGVLGQRYGGRDVTIAGGIFASLGIFLCTFVSDITWITILWGGMHGLGVALGNTLFQVIVTQYFIKYRATASGLAVSGACLGSIIFPLIIEYALINFGLPGTFLITGGLMLHCLPAGIVMKEPPWIRPDVKPVKLSKSLNLPQNSVKHGKTSFSVQMDVIQEDICMSSTRAVSPPNEIYTMTETSDKLRLVGRIDNTGKLLNDKGIDNPSFVSSNLDSKDTEIKNNQNGNVKTEIITTNVEILKGTEQVLVESRRPTRAVSLGEISFTIPVEPLNQLQETSVIKAIVKVWRDPMFHMISLSMAAFAMVFDPAITVIVDYLMDKGLERDVAKYFISLLALADLFGRLCFGWVTDKNYMSIARFMMLLQVIQGICFLLTPLLYSFDSLLTIMVIYGACSGATLVMFPILVGKYLQSVQSMAIGSIQFLSGILSFAVPPCIGYFRDSVGSYDGMFYITGGMSVVVGCLWLLEPMFMNIKAKLDTQ